MMKISSSHAFFIKQNKKENKKEEKMFEKVVNKMKVFDMVVERDRV